MNNNPSSLLPSITQFDDIDQERNDFLLGSTDLFRDSEPKAKVYTVLALEIFVGLF